MFVMITPVKSVGCINIIIYVLHCVCLVHSNIDIFVILLDLISNFFEIVYSLPCKPHL